MWLCSEDSELLGDYSPTKANTTAKSKAPLKPTAGLNGPPATSIQKPTSRPFQAVLPSRSGMQQFRVSLFRVGFRSR